MIHEEIARSERGLCLARCPSTAPRRNPLPSELKGPRHDPLDAPSREDVPPCSLAALALVGCANDVDDEALDDGDVSSEGQAQAQKRQVLTGNVKWKHEINKWEATVDGHDGQHLVCVQLQFGKRSTNSDEPKNSEIEWKYSDDLVCGLGSVTIHRYARPGLEWVNARIWRLYHKDTTQEWADKKPEKKP